MFTVVSFVVQLIAGKIFDLTVAKFVVSGYGCGRGCGKSCEKVENVGVMRKFPFAIFQFAIFHVDFPGVSIWSININSC